MRLNYVTPGALGLALALTITGMTAAEAQVPVRKDTPVVREDPGVVAPEIATVTLRSERATFAVGDTVRLTTDVQAADGRTIYDRRVVYRSENPEVATVTEDGRVIAVSPGTATIVAEVNGREARTTVVVEEARAMEPMEPMEPTEPMEPVEPEPEPPLAVEPLPPPVPMLDRRGAFYWGLAGGANFPMGRLSDAYDTGWNVTMPIGWDPIENAWGMRIDLTYNRLGGRTFAAGPTQLETDPATVWSAMLNGTLRFGARETLARTGPYLIAGLGLHHFRDFAMATTDDPAFIPGDPQFGQWETRNTTRFGINGGAGWAFPIGATSLFIESRYVTVFTEGQNADYVPLIVGITF